MVEEDKDIVTYPLKVNRTKWDKFKETIPRKKDINTALNEMIDERINKKK